jgi:hypothetical protein
MLPVISSEASQGDATMGYHLKLLENFILSFSIQRDLVLLCFDNYYKAMQGDLL